MIHFQLVQLASPLVLVHLAGLLQGSLVEVKGDGILDICKLLIKVNFSLCLLGAH